jgi:drug/metabolite transporter (DMT)-like permease
MRGALLMSVSMAGFLFNDTIVKVLADSLNIGQIMLLRGILATALLTGLACWLGALRPLRLALNRMFILRVIGETGGTVTFLLALRHIPIANASAILQALPLAVTMGAALFLSEPVGWRRWAAIAVGFTGVMIVVRPGMDGFSSYSILVLGTVFFAALRDIATRLIPGDVPSLYISAVTAPIVGLVGLAMMFPMGGWQPVTPDQTGLLLAAAVFLIIGYQCIILAMRSGDISFVAPFRYTNLLWAMLVGFLVFGDVPDVFMIVGATIIVVSGIYTLYRERKRDVEPIAAEVPTRPGS